nr:integrase, catalytic region, zinc finger, CCHC-type, peptidase aspartic, catalytic [Tanacetum cinerariifolium]
QRVEDLQLGVESYQKRLNLTKTDTYRSDLKRREAYTTYSNPRGFIYQNKDKKNRLMRIDELHEFSDGTLNDVRNALDDRLKGIRKQYLPQTIWRKAIMGYEDLQIENILISRVYYVEGLGHNLFPVGKFCDSDIEATFIKHTCFVRNLEGVDPLSGSCGSNLYAISMADMMKSYLIYLLSKASKQNLGCGTIVYLI